MDADRPLGRESALAALLDVLESASPHTDGGKCQWCGAESADPHYALCTWEFYKAMTRQSRKVGGL